MKTADENNSNMKIIWQQIQSLLNAINHILIGLIGIYATLLAKSLNFQDTALHMFLTVIGIHVLIAEALMSHYPYNPLTNRLSHRNKSRYHGILQMIGGSMALLGALGKIRSTEIHFTTWHGKIGLSAAFMCFCSLCGGILNYFQPKFIHKIYTIAEVKCRHNFFGMITFTLTVATILLGYCTQFFFKHVDQDVIPAFVLATAVMYVITMIAPLRSFRNKLKYRKRLIG
uniref:ascorbate ferrireductase (transmembrane) n=1 Tax=Glossina brevipalpis TaxID=37001 RepID=A0A1A9W6W2_9MUSC